MMRRLGYVSCVLAVAMTLATCAAAADGPPQLAPPPPEAIDEARRIVAAMEANDRGPYEAIRWYCKDGTIHPAMPPPCAQRGGGVQHAAYSDQRDRLAQLGWHVGTILTGTPIDELVDAEHGNARLAELAIERYLIATDDGWVLRRARSYRGRLQVEDEQEAGRDLLVALLAVPGWTSDHFLLAREVVRVVPHDDGGDRMRDMRRMAGALATRSRSFEALRSKLHADPAPQDAAAVRNWAAQPEREPSLAADAEALAHAIEVLFGPDGRGMRVERLARSLAKRPEAADVASLFEGVVPVDDDAPKPDPAETLGRLAAALLRLRVLAGSTSDSATALGALDLSLEAEAAASAASREAAATVIASPSKGFVLALDLARAARGCGWLSAGELAALSEDVARLQADPGASAARRAGVARSLERSSAWAVNTVRHDFAEPLARYVALEPKAARFPDDLVRGSVMLALADVSGALARDAERESGLQHLVFGVRTAGLVGLNPGAAVGRLHVASEAELATGTFASGDIVVLPQTVSDLSPVAGILTLSEGNALSHVQLLARNLGIPNVVVPAAAVSVLRAHEGEQVVLATGSRGTVVLAQLSAVPPSVREIVAPASPEEPVGVTLPPVDLSVKRLLPLDELDAHLSGKVVGPKAAHVGELARLFPGRVAPALAIPFGIHAEQLSGSGSPRERLEQAFAQRRSGEIDDTMLAAQVDTVRADIEASRLSAPRQAELAAAMERVFGPAGTYGVFVRSDTNVEDLPLFTGAGLNRTVANVVGFDAVVRAISTVWASPFTPRAMAWRRRVLTHPEDVYPSVLLMRSVPSEKSGVLVTADVVTGGSGLTVATAWGVGGATDSEEAETLVLRDDGSTVLVSEAKAPFQRKLPPTGGVDWAPAPTGPVLTPDEIAQLRRFVVELSSKRAAAAASDADVTAPAPASDESAAPSDVEFGFVHGELTLFQVRPLVERGAALADRVVEALLGAPPVTVRGSVGAGAAGGGT